jgi:hypothetical protein
MDLGIKYVRAGEIFEIRDEDNVLLNDSSRPDERPRGRIGSKRRLRLHLDPSQYYEDMKVRSRPQEVALTSLGRRGML